jgi:hypothetical protein
MTVVLEDESQDVRVRVWAGEEKITIIFIPHPRY